MNAVITLNEAERAIASLSEADKAQLLRWLEKEVKNGFAGIEKTVGVMNGAACIRQTRIPVWLLEQARRQGVGEVDLLRNYPHLSANDLANAWDYVNSHQAEIENSIAANESEDWFGMDDGKIWIADDFDETPEEFLEIIGETE
ncbi:MAG: DUF433 domain-containing protein [Pyrinomonadaceae bacterium]|nr:DUF433 domain-containing protein [Pyrinomonadaceae bacterium]